MCFGNNGPPLKARVTSGTDILETLTGVSQSTKEVGISLFCVDKLFDIACLFAATLVAVRPKRLRRLTEQLKMDVGDSRQAETTSLIIKSPNQAQEDQTIEGVNLTWTVKELKTHLSAVYPSKPVSFSRSAN